MDTAQLYYCTYLLGRRHPFAMMHVELAMYAALMRDQVTEQERALILGGNIQCLFELGD